MQMEVSYHGGPQNHPRSDHYKYWNILKPMVTWGIPHFKKPPYLPPSFLGYLYFDPKPHEPWSNHLLADGIWWENGVLTIPFGGRLGPSASSENHHSPELVLPEILAWPQFGIGCIGCIPSCDGLDPHLTSVSLSNLANIPISPHISPMSAGLEV